jgi:hypothetical protein
MTRQVLFDNKRYDVTIGDALEYEVRNKETGVIELRTPSLVDAIFFAENSDRTLEAKPWEWARSSDLADANNFAYVVPTGGSN